MTVHDKPRRRWLRFSLRSLMLLVLLFAVSLGWMVHKVRQQGIAMAALKKTGCEMRHDIADTRSPGVLEWLRKLLGEEVSRNLTELYGEPSQITDVDLIHLQALTDLELLNLIQTKISDTGLVHLRRLTQLRYLDLSRTQVTDAGLAHLGGLSQLRSVGLLDTAVTDAGLEHLQGLSQLQALNLVNTQVTAAGIQRLHKALPKCKIDWQP